MGNQNYQQMGFQENPNLREEANYPVYDHVNVEPQFRADEPVTMSQITKKILIFIIVVCVAGAIVFIVTKKL